jgi:hypothetical protein
MKLLPYPTSQLPPNILPSHNQLGKAIQDPGL